MRHHRSGFHTRAAAPARSGVFAIVTIGASIAVATLTWIFTPALTRGWTTLTHRPPEAATVLPAAPVYYQGCDEVRALGLAPLRRGSTGYRDGMDGDGDGIACEPIASGYGGRYVTHNRHRRRRR